MTHNVPTTISNVCAVKAIFSLITLTGFMPQFVIYATLPFLLYITQSVRGVVMKIPVELVLMCLQSILGMHLHTPLISVIFFAPLSYGTDLSINWGGFGIIAAVPPFSYASCSVHVEV